MNCAGFLLEGYDVSLGKQLPTFRWNVVPSSSRVKMSKSFSLETLIHRLSSIALIRATDFDPSTVYDGDEIPNLE
jgi:hypothetical protein